MNSASKPHNTYPPWSPRFWNGMRAGPYVSLLASHHFRIHPFKYPMTGLVGCCTVMNSCLAQLQRLIAGKAIAQAELAGPPIFIVGHWRSGTTLLHELISLNPQLAFASNFDSFVPHHLLVSRYFLKWLVDLLLPARRPMDNMTLAAGSPQEDDFALIALGAPTPYLDIAFPNDRFQRRMTFDFEQLPARQQDQLRDALTYFLRVLTIRYGKQLVLKSPPHTARIAYLADWFPGAKFIHIARRPEALRNSTKRLWQALDQTQGYQLPKYSESQLESYIDECHAELYEAYFRQRPQLASNQIVEVQFEQLLAAPEKTIAEAMEQLQLPGIDETLPKVTCYFQRNRDHRPATRITNHTPWLKRPHWQRYMTAFGYAERHNGRHVDGRPSLAAESTCAEKLSN